MKRLSLLAAILLVPAISLAAPHKAKILMTSSSVQMLLNSPKEGSQLTSSIPFTLQYKGKSNKGKLKLRETPLLSKPINGLDDLRLFRGSTRRGGDKISVGASLINGRLKVSFKDGGRLYQSEFQLNSTSPLGLEGILTKTPLYAKIDDGGRPSQVGQLLAHRGTLTSSSAGTLASEMMIELRAVADGSLITLKGGILNAFVSILDTINAGESIYTAQLNTIIRVVDMAVVGNSTLSSNSAFTLLDQFTAIEEEDSAEDHDLSHLFTGKELNGGVVGLAWSPAVCLSPEVRYGLTQMKGVGALATIIFAHEIGHNLGAGHDEVTPSLMYPTVDSEHDSFSGFSLGEISDYLSSASFCLDKDTSEPDPTLSSYLISNVKVTNSGRFLLKTDLFDETTTSSGCLVSLYGALQKSKLQEANILAQATFLAVFGADQGDVKLRVGGISKAVSGGSKVHFRLFAQCDGTQSLSPVVTLTLNNGGTITRAQWLDALSNKELAIIPY